MEELSKNEETLRRVEQNDDTLNTMRIGGGSSDVINGVDFARLGGGIANNHQLIKLSAVVPMVGLSVTNRGFYDGIERNSSIQELFINC